jgi:hypothetical protein
MCWSVCEKAALLRVVRDACAEKKTIEDASGKRDYKIRLILYRHRRRRHYLTRESTRVRYVLSVHVEKATESSPGKRNSETIQTCSCCELGGVCAGSLASGLTRSWRHLVCPTSGWFGYVRASLHEGPRRLRLSRPGLDGTKPWSCCT